MDHFLNKSHGTRGYLREKGKCQADFFLLVCKICYSRFQKVVLRVWCKTSSEFPVSELGPQHLLCFPGCGTLEAEASPEEAVVCGQGSVLRVTVGALGSSVNLTQARII